MPAYFEWWYFHFVTADGAAINMVVHETDIFGGRQQPYLSLSILLPDQPPQYLRCDLADMPIVRGVDFLQVGGGIISESPQTIHFDILLPERGYFRGEIVKQAPPLSIAEGILYQDPDSGRASHWVAHVPHATFTAILQLDGLPQRLHGTAYQDHQWGDILLQEFVSDWVWGHFSNDQMAAIFFQILTQQGQLIERVAWLMGEGRYVGTTLETDYLQTLFAADAPQTYSGGMTVAFLQRQFQLTVNMAPARLMRYRLREVQGQVSASYLRWGATARFSRDEHSQPLHGITEYLRVRPVGKGESLV